MGRLQGIYSSSSLYFLVFAFVAGRLRSHIRTRCREVFIILRLHGGDFEQFSIFQVARAKVADAFIATSS